MAYLQTKELHTYTKTWESYSATGAQTKDSSIETSSVSKLTWKDEPRLSNHLYPTDYRHGSVIMHPTTYDVSNKTAGSKSYDRLTGTVFGPPCVSFNSVSGAIAAGSFNDRSRVTTQAMADLGEGKINIGVTLAETAQTGREVIAAATDVLQALVAIKKGDVKKLRSIFGDAPLGKTIASRWLQYRLGVVPMLSDLKGISDLYDKGIEDNAAGGSKYFIKSESSVSVFNKQEDSSGHSEIHADIRCQIVASVSDSSEHGLQKLGLNSLNSVVWELVPYSFVLDYMLPIGTMIAAFNAPIGLTFEHGYVSVKNFEVRSTEVQISIPGENIGDPIEVISDSESFHRTPIGGFPSVKPYIKNPLSVIHVANVLALIVQARR